MSVYIIYNQISISEQVFFLFFFKKKGKVSDYAESEEGDNSSWEEGECEDKRPANFPLVKISGSSHQLSPEDSARRCGGSRQGRGKVYNPVFGISCHFCRLISLFTLCFFFPFPPTMG